jgi:hypothetical protein
MGGNQRAKIISLRCIRLVAFKELLAMPFQIGEEEFKLQFERLVIFLQVDN